MGGGGGGVSRWQHALSPHTPPPSSSSSSSSATTTTTQSISLPWAFAFSRPGGGVRERDGARRGTCIVDNAGAIDRPTL